MKIILLIGATPACRATGEAPAVGNVIDSALLKGDRPFFIPDDEAPFMVEAHWVARICHTGKTIPARFAHRYINGLALGVSLYSRPLQDSARRNGLPWTLARGFDGAIHVGNFLPTEGCVPNVLPNFSLRLNGNEVMTGRGGDWTEGIADVVARLSRLFTLREGDLLYLGSPKPAVEVHPGQRAECLSDDSRYSLAFNIK